MEYKSVSKFLDKNKKHFNFLIFLKKLTKKVLICILLLLIGLIVIKYDENNEQIIYKYLYENNLSFASINSFFKKYLGDILPFQTEATSKVASVFNEEITYKSLNIYKDGVELNVSESYLVPVLEEGIVIFIGSKDDYGNTVIIQQTNGIDVWYGNVTNINVSLYDYVSKGEFLAVTNNNILYLAFQKKGEFVNYKEYFK